MKKIKVSKQNKKLYVAFDDKAASSRQTNKGGGICSERAWERVRAGQLQKEYERKYGRAKFALSGKETLK